MFKLIFRSPAIVGFFLFALNQFSSGQVLFSTDTLKLNEFTVAQSRQHTFDAGSKKIVADSILMDHNYGSSLNGLLSALAPVNLRVRGTTGSLSTLSLRGAGASRTLVTWNGIALNSLSSGDVNMSLMNTSAFNHISLNYSAPATLYGGSSFGGVLELNNDPVFRKQISIKAGHSAGSYMTHQSNLDLQFANKRFYSQTNIWYAYSANSFTYLDTYYNQSMKRQNAAHRNTGAITTNSIRLGSQHILSSGLWYNENMAGLPPINGSHPNLIVAEQHDRSVRGYLKWAMEQRVYFVSLKTYVFDEYIHYTQKNSPTAEVYSIYSLIRPFKAGLDADIRYNINKQFTLDIGTALYHNMARGSNYEAKPEETNVAVFSALKHQHKKIKTVASVRKEFHTQYSPPVRFGIGTEYQLIDNILLLRATLNQKYRVPTFNDKYWPQSGNPTLKPEKGTTHEAGIAFQHEIHGVNIQADAGAYWNDINDMIVWLPAENGLWKPVNYESVLNKGVESSLKATGTVFANVCMTQSFKFDLNQSREDGSEAQLLYTPKYRFNTANTLRYKHFRSLVEFTYLSRRRYDDSQNTLPEYYQANFSSFYDLAASFALLRFSLKINNIFNHTEPYVKNYPIAGRHFMLGLQITFNHVNR